MWAQEKAKMLAHGLVGESEPCLMDSLSEEMSVHHSVQNLGVRIASELVRHWVSELESGLEPCLVWV
jgi:hypothetical protein